MKISLRLLILLFTLSTSYQLTNAAWVSHSPASVNARAITCMATIGNNVFAGSAAGVFLTTDNGSTWTSVNNGLSDSIVMSMTAVGNKLYIGLNGGAYTSINNGVTWTNISKGLVGTSQIVYSMANNGTWIYAGVEGSGVYRLSVDTGTTWAAANMGLATLFPTTLTASGNTVYAGSQYGELYVSTDQAGSWTQAAHIGLDTSVNQIAVNGSQLLIATSVLGVLSSTDNGAHYTQINTGFPLGVFNNFNVFSLLVDDSLIYAGTQDSSVYVSDNNGASWTLVNTGLPLCYVNSLVNNGSTIFAGTSVAGVWQAPLQQNCNLIASMENKLALCYGVAYDTAFVAVAGGQAPYTYSWSHAFASSDSMAVFTTGANSFAVTVTDANECSISLTGTITTDNIQIHNVNILTLRLCSKPEYANLQVDGQGGTGSFRYTLLGVATNSTGTFNNLPSGDYTVIIADSLGCSENISIQVPANAWANDSFNISTSAITCSTDSDGTITITPLQPLDGFVTYLLDSRDEADSIFTNVSAGVHTIEIENHTSGCYTTTATVDSSTQPCPAACSAHFTLYPDTTTPHNWFALNQATGTGPLGYVWNWGDNTANDTGATPSHIYADSGYYNICLTITDSTGCTSSYCSASTYIRDVQQTMITVNVVTTLPGSAATIVTVAGLVIQTSVYPNPSTGSWQLSVDQSLVGSALNVYDEQGRIVFNSKLQTQNSKLELNIPSGIYYLRITSSVGSVVRKLVKM